MSKWYHPCSSSLTKHTIANNRNTVRLIIKQVAGNHNDKLCHHSQQRKNFMSFEILSVLSYLKHTVEVSSFPAGSVNVLSTVGICSIVEVCCPKREFIKWVPVPELSCLFLESPVLSFATSLYGHNGGTGWMGMSLWQNNNCESFEDWRYLHKALQTCEFDQPVTW